MQTARECYEMADQCEAHAATVKNERARQLLLEVASKWRQLGDDVRAETTLASRYRTSS
jgi:hypothetical protein